MGKACLSKRGASTQQACHCLQSWGCCLVATPLTCSEKVLCSLLPLFCRQQLQCSIASSSLCALCFPHCLCHAWSALAEQQASCPAGTASFEPSVAASIANQPALTGSLAKKLQTLCDIVSELDKEDTENLLSRQVSASGLSYTACIACVCRG